MLLPKNNAGVFRAGLLLVKQWYLVLHFQGGTDAGGGKEGHPGTKAILRLRMRDTERGITCFFIYQCTLFL